MQNMPWQVRLNLTTYVIHGGITMALTAVNHTNHTHGMTCVRAQFPKCLTVTCVFRARKAVALQGPGVSFFKLLVSCCF